MILPISPPSYSHVSAKREKFFNFCLFRCLSEAFPQGVERTIAPRSNYANAPRQQINKYGCTGRSLLVLSFARGMVLGGEERRLRPPQIP